MLCIFIKASFLLLRPQGHRMCVGRCLPLGRHCLRLQGLPKSSAPSVCPPFPSRGSESPLWPIPPWGQPPYLSGLQNSVPGCCFGCVASCPHSLCRSALDLLCATYPGMGGMSVSSWCCSKIPNKIHLKEERFI